MINNTPSAPWCAEGAILSFIRHNKALLAQRVHEPRDEEADQSADENVRRIMHKEIHSAEAYERCDHKSCNSGSSVMEEDAARGCKSYCAVN